MGLDISHDTWHGAYSAFHRWRQHIAKQIGIPLDLMEGFYPYNDPLACVKLACRNDDLTNRQLERHIECFPLLWDAFKPNPLHELLYHSDCDGEIEWSKCEAIATELQNIVNETQDDDLGGHIGSFHEKTRQFIIGCRLAHSKQENLEFT